MKKILLPVLLLVAAVGGFAALRATRPKQPPVPPTEQVWRVETMEVRPATLSPRLTLSGRVESPELTRAAAPGAGRVDRVLVREGQAVRRGELLLALDARDFEPRLIQARGQVDELVAAIDSERLRHAADLDQLEQERRLLQFAAADVERFERLRQENFYSQAAVDQSRQALARQRINLRNRELLIQEHAARLRQLEARLAQARAGLEQAELALARSRVYAPFDGFVAGVQVAQGDQVAAGQVLLTLYPLAGLEVRAKIPAPHQEELQSLVGRGRTLEATARLGGEEVRLKLVRLAGAADARGLDAFFRLERPDARLRVGTLLTLALTRAPVDGAIAVPYSALHGGRLLYRVEGGRIQAVPVTVLGEQAGERPLLLVRAPDLKPGDRVMTTHLSHAVTGMRVEVASP